jgi:hypothetical protein
MSSQTRLILARHFPRTIQNTLINYDWTNASVQSYLTDALEKPISLLDIQILVDLSRRRPMNFHTPWATYEFLMTLSAGKWERLCLDTFTSIETHLKRIITEASKYIFVEFRTNGLEAAVRFVTKSET